jgi:hypothetical protein
LGSQALKSAPSAPLGCHDRTMGDRVLRWMPSALVSVLLGWVVARAARPIDDPDAWWHLRLGNDLINQHSLAAPAHWSVFATVDWVPTEPLPEITAAFVNRWWGLPGLAVLYAIVGIVVVLTVYVVCRRVAAPLPSAVATVLATLASSASLTPRPQLISFVLLPIVIFAWLRTERDHLVRWWLIPLMWVWSLCHGFWVIGASYGVLFVVGFALSRKMSPSLLIRQAALAIGSVGIVALNPVGLGVLEAPFRVNDTARYIQEWQRTDLTSPAALGALAMIVGTAAVCTVTREHTTWPRLLVFLSAVFWTWYAGRTVAVAGLAIAPVFAATLDRLVRIGKADALAHDVPRARSRSEMAGIGALAVTAMVVVGCLAPATSDRPGGVPIALDASLDRLPAGTRVFNAYELGGWVAWRHPDLEQYIDGLITPYSKGHVHDYAIAESASPGWYRVVRGSGARVALIPSNSPLASALVKQGWRQTARDARYLLLEAPAGTP